MTRMSKYGIELYSTLEAETGLATGWKPCGSVNVARTPERMKVLRKQVALARSFGVEVRGDLAARGRRAVPADAHRRPAGALWIPGDGKANPADLTMSLAKGARKRGVRIVEGVEVVAVRSVVGANGPRVAGVGVRRDGERCEIACEVVVNCAGQWARQFGALAGVTVPLYSAEHFYIVTDRIDGVHPMLPVMRDPDGYIYYKEEVGGLVMGGFEPMAKPWTVDPIPSTFQFQLLDEDWDQFEPLMTNAIHRTPCLETAQIKMLLNGPESFTPDGNFILGEAPELRGFFVSAGFNSAGIANSGGAGRLIAEWIVGGSPPGDLGTSTSAASARSGRTAGARRAHRRDARPALRDALAAPGARDRAAAAHEPAVRPAAARGAGSAPRTAGSARTTSAPRPARRRRSHTLGRPDWLDWVVARAARDAAGGRALRPDLVRQAAAAGPRRARGAAAPVRQRDRRRARPDGLHADAQRARRLRERPHRDPARRRPLPDRHRLGAGDARRRLDRAPHRAPAKPRRSSTSAR